MKIIWKNKRTWFAESIFSKPNEYWAYWMLSLRTRSQCKFNVHIHRLCKVCHHLMMWSLRSRPHRILLGIYAWHGVRQYTCSSHPTSETLSLSTADVIITYSAASRSFLIHCTIERIKRRKVVSLQFTSYYLMSKHLHTSLVIITLSDATRTVSNLCNLESLFILPEYGKCLLHIIHTKVINKIIIVWNQTFSSVGNPFGLNPYNGRAFPVFNMTVIN